MDVIERRGDVLSFVSYKTYVPVYSSLNSSQRNKMVNFLLEADYWDRYFADGYGRAVLMISSDLFDENKGEWRCPQLAAKAHVLDAALVGGDHVSLEQLVQQFREHWA